MDLDQKDMGQVPWEAESSDTVDTVNPVSSMNDSSQESSSRALSREKAAWYIGVSGTVGGIAIFAIGAWMRWWSKSQNSILPYIFFGVAVLQIIWSWGYCYFLLNIYKKKQNSESQDLSASDYANVDNIGHE